MSSMARARPSSARPGLGAGRRRGLAAAAGGRRGAARSPARSFPPSHTLSDSLPPALTSEHGRRHPPATPSACLPACLPLLPPSAPVARRPAPPQRGCRKARLALSAFATQRRGGPGKGRREARRGVEGTWEVRKREWEGGRARKGAGRQGGRRKKNVLIDFITEVCGRLHTRLFIQQAFIKCLPCG